MGADQKKYLLWGMKEGIAGKDSVNDGIAGWGRSNKWKFWTAKRGGLTKKMSERYDRTTKTPVVSRRNRQRRVVPGESKATVEAPKVSCA